jgi:hypothetical protein
VRRIGSAPRWGGGEGGRRARGTWWQGQRRAQPFWPVAWTGASCGCFRPRAAQMASAATARCAKRWQQWQQFDSARELCARTSVCSLFPHKEFLCNGQRPPDSHLFPLRALPKLIRVLPNAMMSRATSARRWDASGFTTGFTCVSPRLHSTRWLCLPSARRRTCSSI